MQIRHLKGDAVVHSGLQCIGAYSVEANRQSFNAIVDPIDLRETYQGCEGSLVNMPESNGGKDRLFYSGVQGRLPARIYRENMTIFESLDGGASWELFDTVTLGSSAYSSLVALDEATLGVLYERSTCGTSDCPVVFLPEHISFKTFAV